MVVVIIIVVVVVVVVVICVIGYGDEVMQCEREYSVCKMWKFIT